MPNSPDSAATPEETTPLDRFLAAFQDPACLRAWADNLDDEELAGIPDRPGVCPLACFGAELAGVLGVETFLQTFQTPIVVSYRTLTVYTPYDQNPRLSKATDHKLPDTYQAVVAAVDFVSQPHHTHSLRQEPVTGAEFRRILDQVGIPSSRRPA